LAAEIKLGLTKSRMLTTDVVLIGRIRVHLGRVFPSAMQVWQVNPDSQAAAPDRDEFEHVSPIWLRAEVFVRNVNA